MAIKIGANPLCWMNTDFPHLGEGISVEQCLSEIADIGYVGVEMEDPFLAVLDELPEMLKEYQLSCIGKWHSTKIFENTMEEELTRLHAHLDLLEKFNCDVVNLTECSQAMHQEKKTPLSKRPFLQDPELWKKLCFCLDEMAKVIHDRGFCSAYHHHMGTVVQSKEDILRLLEGTKTLGLLFDSGHLAYAGEEPLTVFHEIRSRITHVHCKAVRPSVLSEKVANDTSFFSAVIDGVFTVPGDEEDSIDFKEIVQTLKNTNYHGWIVMEAEQDPTKAHPYTYAQLGFETLRRCL